MAQQQLSLKPKVISKKTWKAPSYTGMRSPTYQQFYLLNTQMYKDFNEMFDGQINAIQEKIKLISEVCTDKQKTGVV